MVFKIVIFSILLTLGMSEDELSLLDEILDELGDLVVYFGEPLDEELDKAKKGCQRDYKSLLISAQNKIELVFKGLAATVAKAIVPNLSAGKTRVCQLWVEGKVEEALKIAKAVNQEQLLAEAKKLKSQLILALTEAQQTDTKTTFPVFICYLKEFQRKAVNLYPDKDGAKDYAKTIVDMTFEPLISVLESAKGKGEESCELPAITETPVKYKSILLPITKVIANLDK